MCVCGCVYVCVRTRKKRQKEKERKKERERGCVISDWSFQITSNVDLFVSWFGAAIRGSDGREREREREREGGVKSG